MDLYAPFGKTFQFLTPAGNKNTNHPEIDKLLNATPQQAYLTPGSSDLAQATFKVIRNQNLMRKQLLNGEKTNDQNYRLLRDEMSNRKKQLSESVQDYKISLELKKVHKRQT